MVTHAFGGIPVHMLAFLIASLLLLLSPGPTNTLMAVAGAHAGLRRVGGLLLVEIAGYFSAILPLLVFGNVVEHRWPAAALAVKLAMASWVLFLAAKLWMPSAATMASAGVTARRVYVTTLLNPKTLVFAMVLLPAGGRDGLLLRIGCLAFLIAGAALAWGSGGWALCLRDDSGQRCRVIQRMAAVWLATLSVVLVAQVAQA